MKATITARLLCAALALGFVIPAAVSCGGEENKPLPNQTQSAGESTAAETEPEGPKWLDNLPDDLDFGGKEIRFVSAVETKSIALSDTDDTGEIINAALWQRNLDIETRFGLKIKLVAQTGYDSFNKTVTNSITAGSDDYDVFCGHTRFNINLASKHYLRKLNDVENLDLSMPYWNSQYIDSVNYKDNTYWAAGDITTTFISYIYALFVNTNMWNNYFQDTDIYDLVSGGGWTLDRLGQCCEGIYTDLNGDSVADENDLWGLVMQQGHILNGMSFAAGVVYTSTDDEGRYYVSVNNEHTIDVFNKMHSMFYDHDYCLMLANEKFDTPSQIMFSEGRCLIIPATFGVAGTDYLRGMDNDFTIIPFPKYDESQTAYRVNQYDGVPIYGIPITVKDDGLPAIGAALEAMCSMNSSMVLPVYYDVALKNKYTRDERTAGMIDLVHDSITSDFSFAWGDTIQGIYEIFYGNINKNDISSTLAKSEKRWTKNMDKLLTALEED